MPFEIVVIMVSCGMAMIAVGLLAGVRWWRKRTLSRGYLKLIVLAGPLGFIAIEAGWVVTEVGRQPWIIQDVMRTADAVTPMPNVVVPMVALSLVYLVLGVIVCILLKRHVFAVNEEKRSCCPSA